MFLIIWDKSFGAFQEEIPTETIMYGLHKLMDNPHHPVK